MAKMNQKDLYIVDDYFKVMLETRKVDKIALLIVKDEIPCIALYGARELCTRIRRDWTRLLQHHDGIRLARLVLKNGSRNLVMLSLFRAAERIIPIESKAGDRAFETAVAHALGGRVIGGLKYHPCDVVLRDGTRIECKGLTGAMHADYGQDGKLVSSVEVKKAGEAHIQQLLAHWDSWTDEEA